jgi:hypothetical protein
MIHDEKIAAQINELMLEITAKVTDSIYMVLEQCTPEEAERYRKGASYVLGYAYTDVLVPLYAEHPGLKPEGMP